MSLLTDWLDTSGLMPHGLCYQWKPGLLWLHAASDVLIALAYFAIPAALLLLVRRRRDVPFHWMFVCFAVFILACGTTHAMEVWTLWVPVYWLSGGIKAVTAIASVPTAVFLGRMAPRVMDSPSPAELHAANEELRKQGESLRESQKRFQQMAENIREIFWVMDARTRAVTYVSPAFDQICELSAEFLQSEAMSYMKIIHPEDGARVLKALDQMGEGSAFDEEFRIVCQSGIVKWLRSIASPVKDETGKIATFVGSAHDVTEQKRVEQALRRSEEKFAKAFSASPHAIAITALDDGRMIDVNRSFLQMTGLRTEEAVDRTAPEMELWISAKERQEIAEEFKSTGRVRSRQIILQKPAGDHLIVNYCGESIALDGRKCLLSVCEDISDQRRTEARLLEYEKAVEGVEEMITVVDREYHYLLANEAFVKGKALRRDEVIGRFVYEVLDKDLFEKVVKPKLDEAFGGKVVKYEMKHCYPRVGERDVAVSYFPVEGSKEVDRVVCVLQDITDRKQADEEVHRLSRRLLRLQDEERRKIARDLHDSTGQDLVALSATLSQVRAGIPSSRRKLRKQVTECRWMADRTLAEVRTLSYLLHPPMLDESGLEDAVRHFVDGFGERTGIAVALEVSRDFGRLPEGMELGLFRVVQESLTNIQRHSGSFTANVKLLRDQQRVVLQVSDEGRGIAPVSGNQNGAAGGRYGVGIPSMEERAKQVGGELLIVSSHHGTSVQVVVPLHA